MASSIPASACDGAPGDDVSLDADGVAVGMRATRSPGSGASSLEV
jgi:hypothetical protein